MFFDEVKILVRSGDGGDGAVSFLREKFMPMGGPAGGDGGRGGDVVFRVNHRANTLSAFGQKAHFKAQNGKRGGGKNMTGASGDNVVIQVPPGTVVKDADTGAVLADLVERDAEVVLFTGGRGGRGNARFVNSRNQAPRYAERGEPGHERWLILELKLIADVGIVGVPNAGKSTLLSVVSNARPKIANYPFTTLEPNLGVVLKGDRDLVFADIPGLIEGAHAGVGLGHSFLRHVQRTRMLIHLINGESDDPMADFSQINSELALYDERMASKPQIVAFNKIDLPDVQAKWETLKPEFERLGIDVLPISAATQANVQQLVDAVFAKVDTLPDEEPLHVISAAIPEPDATAVPFTITVDEHGAYRVSGHRIERAAAMTHWDNEEAILRFQEILEVLGVSRALEERGVRVGDTVIIGDYELEWSE
ncbi:MAG: GTPase ObgE [Chloroflexi bacterium]|jgi:GTP-binding protein|nr:MAG: GTP-binding protein [Chloroflexi bacterium OLB13]MBC6955302.1 GTPase ObgE [Chloroflexota bacterium]MBV6435892.1 GTPase Obg [Anaerolineae bacterium]MDL1915149.1 GTPase ObgE [Anaerolineae bacterium CFX4]OQY82189.1 MAG: GTPase ObgE [Anaerolineae bacterium UTCFX5]